MVKEYVHGNEDLVFANMIFQRPRSDMLKICLTAGNIHSSKIFDGWCLFIWQNGFYGAHLTKELR